jgi:UDP-N-acetylglucosamine 4,6-dehydratase
MRVTDVAEAVAPGAERRIVGIRPGEKLHEVLLTEDEARHSVEVDNGYVILPEYASWSVREVEAARPLAAGFHYASDINDWWLNADELRSMAADVRADA